MQVRSTASIRRVGKALHSVMLPLATMKMQLDSKGKASNKMHCTSVILTTLQGQSHVQQKMANTTQNKFNCIFVDFLSNITLEFLKNLILGHLLVYYGF